MSTEAATTLPCSGMTELFIGRDGDGRKEKHRAAREARARRMCVDLCDHRMACLERALVMNETLGVWGGMGEAERRDFQTHLRDEGYGASDIPEGNELWAALNAFYNAQAIKIRARYA